MSTQPEQLDPRRRMLPVRDQGNRNTCLVFAVTAAHELRRTTEFEANEDLAEEVLYWACKQVRSPRIPGTTFAAAAAALRKIGQPLEEAWPYSDARDEGSNTYAPPVEAIKPDACHCACLKRVSASVPILKQLLQVGHGVAVAVQIGYGFHTAPRGIVPLPGGGEQLTDRHAVLVIGYDDVVAGGSWLFRNSWGTGWGDNGYGYLPYDYIAQYGAQAWVIECLCDRCPGTP